MGEVGWLAIIFFFGWKTHLRWRWKNSPTLHVVNWRSSKNSSKEESWKNMMSIVCNPWVASRSLLRWFLFLVCRFVFCSDVPGEFGVWSSLKKVVDRKHHGQNRQPDASIIQSRRLVSCALQARQENTSRLQFAISYLKFQELKNEYQWKYVFFSGAMLVLGSVSSYVMSNHHPLWNSNSYRAGWE